MYELLKFVWRSIAGLHSETFSNELFVFDKPSYVTRRSTYILMKIPYFKSKIQKVQLVTEELSFLKYLDKIS